MNSPLERGLTAAALAGLIATACAPGSAGSYPTPDNRSIPAAGAPARPEAPKPDVYKTLSSNLGYQVEVPGSWNALKAGIPNEETLYTDFTSINKIGYEERPGFNLDAYVQQQVNADKRLSALKVRTQNGEGWRLKGRSNGRVEDVDFLWQMVNGKWWWITFTAPNLDAQAAKVDRALATFKVTK